MEEVVYIAVVALLLLGFVLTCVGLAGNVLILVVAVGYAFYTDFVILTWENLLILFGLYLLGEIWEFFIGYLGIKKEKVSWFSVVIIGICTFIGAIIGSFMLPIIGTIIGSVVGAFIATFCTESFSEINKHRALKVAWIAAKNQFLGLVGEIIIAVLMIAVVVGKMFF